MTSVTRREFMCLGAKLAALMGLGSAAGSGMAEALEQLGTGNPPVLWLQGQSCSGCSVSLLNTDAPGPAQLLTRYISLKFHSCLSTATGEVGMKVVNDTIDRGGFFLAVEGSIPAAMPEACIVGHEPITEQVARAAGAAEAVIAVGACAAFGGIPAAQNNPTGAESVSAFLASEGIHKPVINLPGCPSHPAWVVGTLAHVLKFGLPELDEHARPKVIYNRCLHEQCPRFADYEREKFAATFSEEGCLFKLGCLGPVTHADCNVRMWNAGANSCIHAGAPCIGCASEDFARDAALPFHRKTELKLEDDVVARVDK